MRPKKINWLKAQCPICLEEYEYLPDYKPVTCGRFDCIKIAHRRGLFSTKEELIKQKVIEY